MNKRSNVKRSLMAVLMIVLIFASFAIACFADNMTWEGSGLSGISDKLLVVLKYCGATIMVYSIAMVVLSLKDDRTDGMVRYVLSFSAGLAMALAESMISGLV